MLWNNLYLKHLFWKTFEKLKKAGPSVVKEVNPHKPFIKSINSNFVSGSTCEHHFLNMRGCDLPTQLSAIYTWHVIVHNDGEKAVKTLIETIAEAVIVV